MIGDCPDWICVCANKYKEIDSVDNDIPTEEKHILAKKLYESGMTGAAISKEVGISKSLFSYWKKKKFVIHIAEREK